MDHVSTKRFRIPILQKLRGLPEKNKLLVLSLVVGVFSGLAAVVLHTLIRLIRSGLAGLFCPAWACCSPCCSSVT